MRVFGCCWPRRERVTRRNDALAIPTTQETSISARVEPHHETEDRSFLKFRVAGSELRINQLIHSSGVLEAALIQRSMVVSSLIKKMTIIDVGTNDEALQVLLWLGKMTNDFGETVYPQFLDPLLNSVFELASQDRHFLELVIAQAADGNSDCHDRAVLILVNLTILSKSCSRNIHYSRCSSDEVNKLIIERERSSLYESIKKVARQHCLVTRAVYPDFKEDVEVQLFLMSLYQEELGLPKTEMMSYSCEALLGGRPLNDLIISLVDNERDTGICFTKEEFEQAKALLSNSGLGFSWYNLRFIPILGNDCKRLKFNNDSHFIRYRNSLRILLSKIIKKSMPLNQKEKMIESLGLGEKYNELKYDIYEYLKCKKHSETEINRNLKSYMSVIIDSIIMELKEQRSGERVSEIIDDILRTERDKLSLFLNKQSVRDLLGDQYELAASVDLEDVYYLDVFKVLISHFNKNLNLSSPISERIVSWNSLEDILLKSL